jgi:hypothetical protein
MRISSSVCLVGLFGVAALLGGCGNGGSSAGGGKSSDTRGVIASASDCVSFGPDAVRACGTAIERAVARHEAASATYRNIKACETAVGVNQCERAASGKYRAKLSAFMVTIGADAVHAEPLYPVKDGGIGFQTADASKLLASDQSVPFSRLALTVAETQAASSGKKGGKAQKVF